MLPAMRAQYDALAQDVLAHLLEEEETVEKEKVVAPKDSQRIDRFLLWIRRNERDGNLHKPVCGSSAA